MPIPHSLYFIELLHAVPARNQLLIAADVGTGPGRTMVVVLCDPQLRHIQKLLSTHEREYVTAIAASADGHYVAIAIKGDNPDIERDGRIELINVNGAAGPKVVACNIRVGTGVMDLEFSPKGHVLATTGVEDLATRLWNVDDLWECEFSEVFNHIHFISSGDLLCDRGEFLNMNPMNHSGWPTWSPRTLPGWDLLAFDERMGIAFGGESTRGKFIGFGYKPSKVIGFKPSDGSIIGKWVLPYPESEERIEGMEVIHHLLMISQRSRIVLHDTRSMKVTKVLQYDSPSQFTSSAVYLPKEDAIFATNGGAIWSWRLRGMQR